MGCMHSSELPGKLYPCIIRVSEGVAFLRSGKPGLVLVVAAEGILLYLARSCWIMQDFGKRTLFWESELWPPF